MILYQVFMKFAYWIEGKYIQNKYNKQKFLINKEKIASNCDHWRAQWIVFHPKEIYYRKGMKN